MFRRIHDTLLSFDIEWIPDPRAAEMLYGVEACPPHSLHDAFSSLWKAAGADEKNPRPYLKTMLCQIVSIAGIFREVKSTEVELKLISLPVDTSDKEKCEERAIIDSFLKAIGRKKPQLVGYNSINADVPILLQRAVVNGLSGHGFGRRPGKPWEGADYFSTASDFHVDLASALGRGYNTPRLHEAATVCGIPGKVDAAGDQVWEMFLRGRWREIVEYNEFDALTTHLLWARMARFGDLLSDTEYQHEQKLIRTLVENEIESGKIHLKKYLEVWNRLRRP